MSWRRIAFFVIDGALQKVVEGIYRETGTQPLGSKVRVLRRPRAFPRDLPVGPAPEPPDWSELISAASARGSQQKLDATFLAFFQKMEDELLEARAIGPLERPKYRGRGQPPKLVWAPALR
eukprot:6389424-Pyramimonas_sp.AAC.1